MSFESGYKKLNVYKKADELVLMIYKMTKSFPKDELFSLVSQMRRAAISVPANIVEGYGRNTNKDKTHFYYMSRGSLNELEYYLDLSFKLSYIDKKEYEEALNLRTDVGRLLNGFMEFTAK